MPKSTKLAFVTALIGVLVFLVASLGHRFEMLNMETAFALLGLAAFFSFLGSLLSIVALMDARPGKPGFVLTLFAAFLSASVAIPMGIQMNRARSLPPIHDLSTDTEDPPLFSMLLTHREGAENSAIYGGPPVARLQRMAYPDIQSILYAAPPDQAFDRALETAKDLDWKIVLSDKLAGKIEASDTSPVLGFVDDVVVRVKEVGAHESKIDIRSLSREGKGDLGRNAERIRKFIARFGSSQP